MASGERKLTARWLTASRWADFEALVGENGACAGCWCMWFRLPAAEWGRGKGEPNRRALRAIVESGRRPGLLAYAGKEAIGWCAVAPREEYVRLANARTLKPIDDRPVWSVSCLFVRKDWRRRGVTVWLLKEAADAVAGRGGQLVEGYPVVPKGRQPDAFVFQGTLEAFERAGYVVVKRPSASRAIVRRETGIPRKAKPVAARATKKSAGRKATRKGAR